jgi:hypothetical protein
MVSKSLDVYVLLKLSLLDDFSSYVGLGNQLMMSSSEVHASVQRSIIAGLIHPESRLPLRRPFEEYLFHGVRYAFPAPLGAASRGIPTAYAAPPLNQLIEYSDLPPVWLSGKGDVKGVRIEPLHKSAQHMREKDPDFYELLALVDALRMGRQREYNLAVEELKRRLFSARS